MSKNYWLAASVERPPVRGGVYEFLGNSGAAPLSRQNLCKKPLSLLAKV
jgi:hypothetical protein